MLNPQWLRTFVTLSEQRSFTRCAERLNLTQAAVSQHIQRLEAQLGLLLLRRPRRFELTPAGLALLDYCAEVGAADQRLQQRLSADEPAQGDIRLTCPGSIGLALYPLLLDLQQRSPGLRIHQRIAPDPEVIAAVLDNRFELGLTTLPTDDPRLQASRFASEPLELVVPAGVRIQHWDDLHTLGFIDHPDGQAMAARLLSRYYPGAPGINKLPRHGFINQIGMILEPVARGLGFTVLPRYARQAFARPDAISVVATDKPVVDTLWLIHRAEWPLTARAEHVVSYLRERLEPRD